jgi:spore germination cell wall hydrolase CwlJ-like protein
MRLLIFLWMISFPIEVSELPIENVNSIEKINETFEVKYEKIDAIDQEIYCLTEALYFESRSLPEKGQAMVAMVIINRTKSKKFPNTICEVVRQPSKNPKLPKHCAFTYFCNGLPEIVDDHLAWDKALQIAHKAIRGDYKRLTSADHYTRCDLTISWQKEMKLVNSDSVHCFYKS